MSKSNSAIMTVRAPLSVADQASIHSFRERATAWATKNQWAVGAAEIALGASLLAWGIHSGAIDMGSQIVGSALSSSLGGGAIGALGSGGIGALATALVGSIGVVGMGTAVAVPALLLIGAGTAVFAAFGYTAGDMAQNFLNPSFSDFLGPASASLVGVALIVDGCRRLIKDEAVLGLVSRLANGAIELTRMTGTIVANSINDLKSIAKAMAAMPEDAIDATGSVVSGLAAGAAGTAAGAAIAASTVTVLGSGTLGSAAIAMGLVSAPLWPVIAGGTASLAVGYAVWKAARHFILKPSEELLPAAE